MKSMSADDRLLFCDGMRHIFSQSQELIHRAALCIARQLEAGGAPHG